MIEDVIRDAAEKMVREIFPHILIPAAMEARVTAVKELGPTYEYKDMTIDACDICGALEEKKIIGKWYEYTLRILDKHGGVDAQYPAIPQVKSKIQIESGGKAAVIMLYGELRPYIVGEAK